MNKQSFCVANWKMNKNIQQSVDYLKQLNALDLSVSQSKTILCPSFISIDD